MSVSDIAALRILEMLRLLEGIRFRAICRTQKKDGRFYRPSGTETIENDWRVGADTSITGMIILVMRLAVLTLMMRIIVVVMPAVLAVIMMIAVMMIAMRFRRMGSNLGGRFPAC